MSRLKIKFVEDWQEVESCETAPALLAEMEGRLFQLKPDLAVHHDFGKVGPVDCPIAYDALSNMAYRYVSPPNLARRDYSELRAFDLETQASKPILRLPLNQWVLWQLEWIEGPSEDAGQLFGLLAADRPADDRVIIEHRLFALGARDGQMKMRPLCRDAYRPLAFNRKRRELIFSGAEGIYLVNLRGVRVAMMPQTDTTGHGASFDPSGAPRAVLGGDGIFIWDFESSESRRLTRAGRNPVWDASRNGIWYQESSSDLYFFNLDSGESTKVFDVQGNRNPELWYSRPVKQTKCGRYLAVAVTAKKLKGLSRKANATGSRERVYVHEHALYILDLEQQVYWSREGFMNQMCWVE
ncbi:MAG: hypothetical protein ACON4O_08170 [Lentimonas sp.]